ncbi:MAG: hypothetical protein J6Y25_04065 [Elusimicrobiaceae bacterium]|nr:hypothetical protein [Elusimicrobiaceae bacterium]
MIEIGTGFLKAWSAAGQAQRARKNQYRAWEQQAQEKLESLQQAQQEKTAYLFRTTAEKTRQAYENARAELARQQAAWAAHGVTLESASADEAARTIQTQAALQAAKEQRALQTTAAAQEQEHNSKWQQLLEAMRQYRRAGNKKGRLGRLGNALASLFK